jgi:hypothetical protein
LMTCEDLFMGNFFLSSSDIVELLQVCGLEIGLY